MEVNMRRAFLALVAATTFINLEVNPPTASATAAGLLSSTAGVPKGVSNVIAVNHWRYNYWCCGRGYYPPPAYYAQPVPRYYAPPVDYYGYDDTYVVRHRRVRYYDDW